MNNNKPYSKYYCPDDNDGSEFPYMAVVPQFDSADLADTGKRRVVVRHTINSKPVIEVADAYVVSAGWVIGIEN